VQVGPCPVCGKTISYDSTLCPECGWIGVQSPTIDECVEIGLSVLELTHPDDAQIVVVEHRRRHVELEMAPLGTPHPPPRAPIAEDSPPTEPLSPTVPLPKRWAHLRAPKSVPLHKNVIGELERLGALLERGLLTREEFETLKAAVLGPSLPG
jgi:hypothetical protein